MRNAVKTLTVAVATCLALATARTDGQAPAPTPPLPSEAPAPQPTPAAAPQPTTSSTVPLQVDVVLSRYRGDKKVSSTPYTLALSSDNNNASLRMGTQVAVPTQATAAQPNPATAQFPVPFTYRDVGTNIDCRALSLGTGRYQVMLTVADSYPFTEVLDGTPRVANIPMFRSFQSSARLVLRDGQSTEFMAAADRISGEVTRIDVTLRVQK